ncbi:hypothetical protein PEC301879_14950 [Pectobacterium carotovorum subsp. carotovorum]|nr:hypothetical protein PEC301879_14950 [Pectobacterium carotovorum subsp. carotovorum]
MIKRFFLTLALLTLSASSLAQDALPEVMKSIEKQGITIIKPFIAPSGVQGWLGSYQGVGVTIYLAPNGKHAISGYRYDEHGNNLSEALIQQEVYVPVGRKMWQKLQQVVELPDAQQLAEMMGK